MKKHHEYIINAKHVFTVHTGYIKTLFKFTVFLKIYYDKTLLFIINKQIRVLQKRPLYFYMFKKAFNMAQTSTYIYSANLA